MTPNVWFKILFAGVALLIAVLCGWYPEHLALVAYKAQVTAEGKVQIQHNKDLLTQQQLITKQVINDYENKLARIKSYYSGLRYPSGSRLSSTSSVPTASETDGTPADSQFAEKCAATTLQLEALQDYERSRASIK